MLKFYKNISITIFTLILFFLLGEAAARVYDKVKGLNIDIHVYGCNIAQDARFLEFCFKPSSSQKDFVGQEYKINSLGFPGGEFKIKKPEGTFRILCLGASTTLAGDYPEKLKDILRQRYPDKKIEVINCALHGWSTTHNLINYILRLTYLDADLIIPYFCPDETNLLQNGYFSNLGRIKHLKIGFLKKRSVFYNILCNRLSKFKIYLGEFRWRRRVERDYKAVLAEEKEYVETASIYTEIYRTNLENLIILIKARGSEILLSTFATIYAEDMTKERYLHARYPLRHIYLLQKTADMNNDIIKDLAEIYSLPLSDNALEMPKELDKFNDLYHLTGAGARRLAENIANAIIKYNLIK